MTTDSERIQTLERTVTSLQIDVKKHDHAIYGNGSPGLKTQVSVLESGKLQTAGAIHMGISITAVIVAIGAVIVAIWSAAPSAIH